MDPNSNDIDNLLALFGVASTNTLKELGDIS
jgi:hypothetical protein